MGLSPGMALAWIGFAALLSASLSWAAIIYARRRAMFDLPGRRRSHQLATPRGGGVAIVLVVAAAAAMLLPYDATAVLPAFIAGLLGVALVGWVDDHRSISALLRLSIHFAAATLFVACLPSAAGSSPMSAHGVLFALKVLALATAINFFNFMDGINGLITTQTAWVALCVAALCMLSGHAVPALLAATLAAACIGFLPFNFPHARIFLGDVGSGGLGFACGALLLWCDATEAASPWVLLPIASVIGTDAGLTLLSRMLRGRRWYTPHREHLYQWMVRSGRDHASTTLIYLGWNLMLVLPVLWISRSFPAIAPLAATTALVAAGMAWWFGKQRLLTRARAGARCR
jgi:UDP-N-acetylmuramyl pentapeptide phosphotransferase/UDP-N-acetylglucosamine-1-phosphate transferase